MAFHAAEKADDGYARRFTYVVGADGKIEQAIDTKDPGAQAAKILGN